MRWKRGAQIFTTRAKKHTDPEVNILKINKATDDGNVCDVIGAWMIMGMWAGMVACSVDDGIFVQNEHVRQDLHSTE